MTTVIPALSGGMGSARAVLQPSEAGKSSDFSELLAQAGSEADSRQESTATTSAVVADTTDQAESADTAAAESDAGQSTSANELASNDDSARSHDLPESEANERAQDRALHGEISIPVMAPGGKVLPEAANASAEPEHEGSFTQRNNPAAAGEQLGASRQASHPSTFGSDRTASVQSPVADDGEHQFQERKAVVQAAAAEDTEFSLNEKTPARGSVQEMAAEQKQGREESSALPQAGKAEPSQNGKIPLNGINVSLASESERGSTSPVFTETASSMQTGDKTSSSISAAADAELADELPADRINLRQPNAQAQAGVAEQARSTASGPASPAGAESQSADGGAQAEQAAQPRQDAAVTRQDSQRQPATPEWLAQIEHGRRWQQAQQVTTPTDKPSVSNAEASDTERQAGETVLDTKAESTESEDAPSRIERLAEAITLAQGSGSREASAQQTATQDGQAQFAGMTAGREAGATAFERAPVSQAERTLNLHQGAPEQNARQLSQQVQVMVNQELQEADIRLNPSELGGMRIQLKFDQGEVSMHIQAQHAQAREMLEQAMPRLRDMLNQQGIQLGQGQVGGFASQQGTAQNGASGQGATGGENGHNSSPFESDSGDGEPGYGAHPAGSFSNDGRIDFFA